MTWINCGRVSNLTEPVSYTMMPPRLHVDAITHGEHPSRSQNSDLYMCILAWARYIEVMISVCCFSIMLRLTYQMTINNKIPRLASRNPRLSVGIISLKLHLDSIGQCTRHLARYSKNGESLAVSRASMDWPRY
jgi:hypothetical protein